MQQVNLRRHSQQQHLYAIQCFATCWMSVQYSAALWSCFVLFFLIGPPVLKKIISVTFALLNFPFSSAPVCLLQISAVSCAGSEQCVYLKLLGQSSTPVLFKRCQHVLLILNKSKQWVESSIELQTIVLILFWTSSSLLAIYFCKRVLISLIWSASIKNVGEWDCKHVKYVFWFFLLLRNCETFHDWLPWIQKFCTCLFIQCIY